MRRLNPARLRQLLGRAADAARVIVGVPSYRVYCEHMRQCHPDRPVLTQAEFFRDRQDARYARGRGGRCC